MNVNKAKKIKTSRMDKNNSTPLNRKDVAGEAKQAMELKILPALAK